ncbi:MAG: hypothetical protein ASARMPREDX12_002488 [Alectoria sarmentosa]|nr:MAG: hypothetical protein ASARMPREDX12_002488 [Alectoria sarmentosa]
MATEWSRSPVQNSEIAIAVMLPPSLPSQPPQPSLAGSLGKRKRGQESVVGSVVAATSASYGFAPSVKEKVEKFNGGFQCWHCSAPKSHICHVIGRRERVLFQDLQLQGRLSIQHPDQAENAIPLCPLCHDALDEISSPGWVFIPTDLQYFLDFERRDYKRRREMLTTTGAYTVRVSPSPGQYLQHQHKEVEEDAHGGLYTCYVLRHYMGRMPGMSQMRPGLSPYTEPKTWHGDPMAALSKAFKAVGMTPLAFPADVRNKLMELSILYGTNDQLLNDRPRRQSDMDLEDGPGPSPCTSTNEESEHQSKTGTGRSRGSACQRALSPSKRQRGAPDGLQAHRTILKRKRSRGDEHEDMNTPPSDTRGWRKRPMPEIHWKWGPGATSEMAMDFYDSIYHIPQKQMTTSLEAKEHCKKIPRESLLPSPKSSEKNGSTGRSPIPKSHQEKPESLSDSKMEHEHAVSLNG